MQPEHGGARGVDAARLAVRSDVAGIDLAVVADRHLAGQQVDVVGAADLVERVLEAEPGLGGDQVRDLLAPLGQDLGRGGEDLLAVVTGELGLVGVADPEGLRHLRGARRRHRADERAGVGVAHLDALLAVDQLAGDAHLLVRLDRQLRLPHPLLHSQLRSSLRLAYADRMRSMPSSPSTSATAASAPAHVLRIEPADAADAEAVGHRQLARIDDVAAILQLVVEALEHELRILGHMECDDDRRLQPIGQQRPEAQLAHALDQDLAVLRVARPAAGLSALGPELLQRLVEGDDHVDRRREAVLPGLGEVLPLIVQIEHQRGGVALGLGQRRLAADDEAEPGNALDALVGGGGDGIEPRLGGVERQRAERAHGIDQQPASMLLDQRADLGNRVQDAAGRLALHGKHVRDGRDRPSACARSRRGRAACPPPSRAPRSGARRSGRCAWRAGRRRR